MTAETIYRSLILLMFAGLINACVEPYDFATEDFESVLVIDAQITNELKKHEISLTRTYPLEAEEAPAEVDARVKIFDDAENEFLFVETSPGNYISTEEFQPLGDRQYTLEILTQDGNLYRSDPVVLIRGGKIKDLMANKIVHEGQLGVGLQMSSLSEAETSPYYKFEYEETYKIVSPYESNEDLVVINGEFIEVPKTREEEICYKTVVSNDIILASTNDLTENTLEDFMVKFVSRDDPALAWRYSILVKQYALSGEGYSYYEALKKLAGSGSLFSQNQPGFVQGNIFSIDRPEEKVIGFFQISTVSSKRIFFSYEDFFDPFEDRPSMVECNLFNPPIDLPPGVEENLIYLLESGSVKYVGKTVPVDENQGPYLVVDAECVDCTLLGTNEVPEFWEE